MMFTCPKPDYRISCWTSPLFLILLSLFYFLSLCSNFDLPSSLFHSLCFLHAVVEYITSDSKLDLPHLAILSRRVPFLITGS